MADSNRWLQVLIGSTNNDDSSIIEGGAGHKTVLLTATMAEQVMPIMMAFVAVMIMVLVSATKGN